MDCCCEYVRLIYLFWYYQYKINKYDAKGKLKLPDRISRNIQD